MATLLRTKLIKIGTWAAVCIPKSMLAQLNVSDLVELEIHDNHLIMRASTSPRAGWGVQFQQMAATGDDSLLDQDALNIFDNEEWQWQ